VQGVFYKRGYVVDSKTIGNGWRAVVYKATEISSGKIVAIKIADPYGDALTPEVCRTYCNSMKSVIGFWKNYKIFNHDIPVLAQLYEAGFIPSEEMRGYIQASNKDLLERIQWDYHYQVMEYLEGESLESLVEKEFFKGKDMDALIDSLIEFASGVDAMHKKGVAHGELLSKNIFVLSGEKIGFKLVDLDPMRPVGDGIEKDYSYLKWIFTLILSQASKGNAYEPIIKRFLDEWPKEAILEKGLQAFAEDLKKLKSSENAPIFQKISVSLSQIIDKLGPSRTVLSAN
jgi:serine/threonine protein kinase